jgi:hypothetical protein
MKQNITGKIRTMKRILAILLCVAVVFGMCGCYLGSAAKERRTAHKKALKFFEYIKDENIDKLTDMFSDDTRSEYDVEQQWEDFFDSVDGQIESYGKLKVTDSEVWYDGGKVTHALITVSFTDVVTDEGVRYDELSYEHVVTDKDKDAVGIKVLEILDSDEEEVAVVGGIGRYNE